jgi:DNA-binding NtrC family response regulator/tetratricopeptide (TPR) repeat protein
MNGRLKIDNDSFSFVSRVHPSWRFDGQKGFSLKNLKSIPEKIEAFTGFLSGLAFLEGCSKGGFETDAFVLDENNLPGLAAEKFHAETPLQKDALKHFLLSVLFSNKNPFRGKIPKELDFTVRWVRKDFCSGDNSFRFLLAGFLEAAENDGFRVKLPPLWSAGVLWSPPEKPGRSQTHCLSPKNRFYKLALRNWAVANSMRFISLESDIPYPYSSLEPLARALFHESDKDEASLWLKEFLPLGEEKIVDELRKLLSREAGVVFWGRKIDSGSRKIIDALAEGEHPPMTVCFDMEANSPGTIKDASLLWLSEEGENWYKQNAAALGYESPDSLVELLSEEDPLVCSSACPLFPERFSKLKASVGKGSGHNIPVTFWASAFKAGTGIEAVKLKARALIEEGQISLGLDFLRGLAVEERKKPEVRFLQALAASRLGNYAEVLKEAAKIKEDFSDDDEWILELLKAQALWLSGKTDEGRNILLRLLKEETGPGNRFRLLCQLSMFYLNSNDAQKAQDFFRDAKELALNFNPGPMENFLLFHHSGTLERVMDRLSNALEDFTKAAEWAGKGGFHFLQAWCYVESGNILRLAGNFEESLSMFDKAISGARALRLDYLADTAKFDAIVTEIEAGKLLKAEEEIRSLIENRKVKAPPLEQAVEYYWLARILFIRGQLIPAVDEIEKGLVVLSGAGSPETRTAMLILKGNILHSLNDYRSLTHVLNKLSEEESVFREEPDLALEYAALLLIAKSLKIDKISTISLATFEKLSPRASPVAMSSYLLAKARTAKKDEALDCATKAYELGRKMNSIQVKADALAVLQILGRVPSLNETELDGIEKYLRENKITGAVSGLLALMDKKRAPGKNIDCGALDFLSRAKDRSYSETAKELLAVTGADALMLVSPPSPLLEWGNCGEYVRGELISLTGTEFNRPCGGNHVCGFRGCGGIWGAIVTSSPADDEILNIFRLWLSLPRPREEAGAEEVVDLSFSEIDSILIGSSPLMLQLKREIIESAPFNFPILLTGEPGTGKEVCARALHFMSSRARKNWTAFNCANLTPTLAASQLFGHKKGSFTGADSDKEGLVEAAKDSTLFLDEIGELPVETQSQFLRYLQDGSYQPLGSNVTRNSNARIVAATNRKLEDEIKKGSFREDLYYRLKVISIEVPPLKDRKEDIISLFEYFLEQESQKEKIRKPELDKGVHLRLISHSWPGNVRELQNFVRKLLVASHKKGIIEESMVEFEKSRAASSSSLSLKRKLESSEKELVLELLKKHDFNFVSASKEGGLSRQALYQRAKKLGLLKNR